MIHMLNLIITDAEIELVPAEIADHPSIRRRAKRRNKKGQELLLDSNYDYRAMRRLPQGERRGRPDIAHICLLNALDSIPSREGQLRVYVHTRNDRVFRFASETRLPRSQHRFYGILESLLKKEEGTDLIGYERLSLRQLVDRIEPDFSVAFSIRGSQLDISDRLNSAERVVAMVGGFPRGNFKSPALELADEVVRFYNRPLDAWTVVNGLICDYQRRGS